MVHSTSKSIVSKNGNSPATDLSQTIQALVAENSIQGFDIAKPTPITKTAYQIDRDEFVETLGLKNKKGVWDSEIVGIKFAFKLALPEAATEEEGGMIKVRLTHIQASKMVYQSAENGGHVRLYEVPEPVFKIQPKHVFQVLKAGSILNTNEQHIIVPSTRHQSEHFDFYDPKVDFVIFNMDQLKIILDNYPTFIITGSQIDYGSILYPNPGDPASGDQKYFSLKIEAPANYPTAEAKSKTGVAEHPMPSTIVGLPCPPDWQNQTP